MAYIPRFNRTVLPDTARPDNVEIGSEQSRIDAQQARQAQQQIGQITNTQQEYATRDAMANNATWVNDNVIKYKRDILDLTDKARQDRAGSPEGFANDLDVQLGKLSDTYLASAPSQAAREAAKVSIENTRLSEKDTNINWQRQRQTEIYGSRVETAGQNLSDLAQNRGKTGGNIDDLIRDAQATAVAGSTFVAPDKVGKINKTLQENIVNSYMQGRMKNNPAQFKADLAAGAFDKYTKPLTPEENYKSSIDVVMGNEGGYVPVDGASGAPAIYGINAKANPDAYDQAKKITDEKGASAGQQYAQEFYKQNYWDKYNIGSLPPEDQTIVFDGVINHRTGFAQDLVAAAQKGASPADLIKMRQDEYTRLAQNPKYAPSLNGWMNRLNTVQAESARVDAIVTPEKLEKYKDAADGEFKKQQSDEALDRVMTEATTKNDVYQQFLTGQLNQGQISDMQKQGKISLEFGNYMEQALKKTDNEADPQKYVDLWDKYVDLFPGQGKKQKFNSDKDIQDGLRFQNDIMKSVANGEITKDQATSLMKSTTELLAKKVQETRGGNGKPNMVLNLFGFGKNDPYELGIRGVQQYLEQNKMEDNAPLKAKMLRQMTSEIDKANFPPDFLSNKDSVGKLNAIVSGVTRDNMLSANPILLTHPDPPNNLLTTQGNAVKNINPASQAKPDTSVKSNFVVKKGKDGNNYKVFNDGTFTRM